MSSHLVLDKAAFDPAAISQATHDFNQKLQDIMSKGPKWYEVGAEKYRQMRAAGETPLPAATLLDSAVSTSVPSRDSGRAIPCRILKPTKKSVTGVFMHIHGGGWVLQNETSQDPMLQDIADATGLLVLSVGYRLAPEHAYPAATNDCFDVAEWLIRNAETELGHKLSFVGGESAGGHLSMLVALHILQHSSPEINSTRLKGLLLNFGVYDISFSPSVFLFKKDPILVLDMDLMTHYLDAFVPGSTVEQRKDPNLSPLFADLESLRGKLPPAIFTCGTADCLLDDTVFMSAKWQMAGAETVVKIMPGAPHGYIMYPRDLKGSLSAEGLDFVEEFVNTKLSRQ